MKQSLPKLILRKSVGHISFLQCNCIKRLILTNHRDLYLGRFRIVWMKAETVMKLAE